MSGDEHVHGPSPLDEVDPAPLHAVVDDLARALHAYVDQAVGVRAEFGAAESDEDPRVLATETRVASLNARLYDALHDSLGMHPELTASVWEGDGSDADAPPSEDVAEAFYLGFVVAQPPGVTDSGLDGVLDLLDDAGAQVVGGLDAAGYDVVEWAASRGEAAGFGGADEDGEHR